MTNLNRGNSEKNAKLHRYNSFAKLQASSKSIRAKKIKLYVYRGGYLYKSSAQFQTSEHSQTTTEIKPIEHHLQWSVIKRIPDGFQRWPYVKAFWSDLCNEKRREAIKVVISMFGIIATASAALGLILTVWGAVEDRKLTQERLITDRFSKAATLLSNDDKAARIAAIFSLERIAKDSAKDHWTIMELLSAYVLENSPLVNKESTKLPKPISNDVQAALTIISRRESEQDQGKKLDLSSRNLMGANLRSANLRSTNLRSTNLRSANLSGVNPMTVKLMGADKFIAFFLSRADLSRADLRGANLSDADLSSADISDATFMGVDLSNADLMGADLRNTNLFLAYLPSANLSSADLRGANLSSANLRNTNLLLAYLPNAKLTSANLSSANLRGTNLSSANLSSTNLSSADLSNAILLSTDLRKTKNLTQSQLEGKEPPLICNSMLPQNIKINPNRDCDKVAAALHKRYLKWYEDLDEAEKYVQEQRQK